MAKWTTTCFGPYWPSSGCLKRTGLDLTIRMHFARTRGVDISTYELFYLQGHSSPYDAAELRENDGEQASTQLRNHARAKHTSTYSFTFVNKKSRM